MEIKYLKDAPLGKKGQTAVVQDHEGKILIALGLAKAVKPKLKIEVQDQEAKSLLNLNGTPVVDDFGSIAVETNE